LKPQLVDFSGINYFGGGNKVKQVCSINPSDFQTSFKKLSTEMRLKVLHKYMKDRSKGGLYKKEGSRTIGEYFGVGKDMIATLIKTLEQNKKIISLSDLDKYYKVKEEY
jgi:hypothetical protein